MKRRYKINMHFLIGIIILTAVFLSVNCIVADGIEKSVDVEIQVSDEVKYTDVGVDVPVDIFFNNISYFNDQVYLSYHIFDTDGNPVISENERIKIDINDAGHYRTVLRIDLSMAESIELRENLCLNFDIVDEKNAYWFSTKEDLVFQTVTIGFNKTMQQKLVEEIRNSKLIFLGNILCFIGVCIAVGWFYIKAKPEKTSKKDELTPLKEKTHFVDVLKVYGEKRWVRNIGILLIYIGAVCFTYRTIISTEFLSIGGDGIGYYMSKVFFADGIKAGEFPLWDPYSSIGNPFLADTQNTALSPFNILFLFLDPVLAFNLMYLIFMIMAGFFMYLLVYEFTNKYSVSMISGFLLSFATMMSGRRIEHTTIIATFAFFPAVIYYLEKYRRSEKESWLILSSVTMAVQFVCGFTQIVLYFDIVVFGYLLFIFFDRKLAMKKSVITFVKWFSAYILLIAIQLLPTARIIVQTGRNEIPWEAFSALAYDLRILLMMIAPDMYHNHFEAFDDYSSSGLDIEIYIGVICLIYIIYVIVYRWKDRRVKELTILASLTFLFGMVPNIPVVGRIFYHIPLLNSFRVCGRALPIFAFLAIVLAGVGMVYLYDKKCIPQILKINIILQSIITIILIFMVCFTTQSIFKDGAYSEYFNNSIRAILIAWALCAVNLVGLIVLLKINKKYVFNIVMVFIGVLMIADVMRYSVLAPQYRTDVATRADAGLSELTGELINQDTKEHYRSFVINTTFEDVLSSDILNVAEAERSRGTQNKLYNGYLTFLDNQFNYWGIKETVYYPETTKMIKENLSVLSMMGIRHIFEKYDHDVNSEVIDESVEPQLKSMTNDVCFQDGGSILMYTELADWLEKDSTYLLTCKVESEVPTLFYADLYNDQYDSPEQDCAFSKEVGCTYQAMISTEDIPSDEVYIRLIASSETNLKVSDLKIEKVHTEDLLKETVDESNLQYGTDKVSFQKDGDLLIYTILVDWLEEDAGYLVTVEMNSEVPALFYADFYNNQYDDPEQDGYFEKIDEDTYQTEISIEDIPNDEVYFRIIASAETKLEITDLQIEKSNGDPIVTIFENPGARQVIYVPDYVVEKNEWGSDWKEDGLYDVDRVSYVPGIGQNMDLTSSGSEVKSIVERRNSVEAIIYSDTETFVNHAQLAYPGWKAYIDGEEVKLYTVNQLIQGTIVPQGEHKVEFRYEPGDFKVGMAMSLLGIILCCAWAIQSEKKGVIKT